MIILFSVLGVVLILEGLNLLPRVSEVFAEIKVNE